MILDIGPTAFTIPTHGKPSRAAAPQVQVLLALRSGDRGSGHQQAERNWHPQSPATHSVSWADPGFAAFLQLTDGFGRYEVQVEVHDLREDQIAAAVKGPILEVDTPLRTFIVAIPIPPLLLNHPGKYDVVVLANHHEVERQPFTATEGAGS